MSPDPSHGAGARPGPVARILLDERLLDALVARMRSTPAVAEGVRLRAADPALGVVAAEVELAIVSTRLELTRADHGRARAHVLMSGKVTWDFGLTQVSQDLDVRFSVLARPWVVLRDGTGLEVGVDFGSAKVRDVDVTVHQMTSLPVGRASDLIGPVGRRGLDRISGEAIRQFLRRIGRREMVLETPIAEWLVLLGARTGRVAVSVHDGCGELRFDAPEDWAWEPPPVATDPAGPGSIVVDVDPTRAAPLVEHWLGSLASDRERYTVAAFRPGAAGDHMPFELDVGLDRELPGPLPPLSLPVRVEVAPHVHDARVGFELVDLQIPARRGGRRVLALIARVLAWKLANRLEIPGRWDLALPFGDHQGWLLGMRSLDVDHERVRVVLDTWFTPA